MTMVRDLSSIITGGGGGSYKTRGGGGGEGGGCLSHAKGGVGLNKFWGRLNMGA